MKSRYKIEAPCEFKHLVTKPKRQKMIEGNYHDKFVDREDEIQRENRILLDKMTHILQQRQVQSQDFTHSAPSSMSQLPPLRKSLNRDRRKQELIRITEENQRILQRLQDKKAIYNMS